MNREQILSALDEEIAKLTSARDLLMTTSPVVARAPGRSKDSTANTQNASVDTGASKGRRAMSPEGKARIAEAQRKRWAATKKVNRAKPVSTKQSSTTKKSSPKETDLPGGKKVVSKKTPGRKSAPPAPPTPAGV